MSASQDPIPAPQASKIMKTMKFIPLLALPLLFTPQIASAAVPGAIVANPGIYSKLVLANQNLLMYLSSSVFNNFGLGLISYAMILKSVTHVPMQFMMNQLGSLIGRVKGSMMSMGMDQ